MRGMWRLGAAGIAMMTVLLQGSTQLDGKIDQQLDTRADREQGAIDRSPIRAATPTSSRLAESSPVEAPTSEPSASSRVPDETPTARRPESPQVARGEQEDRRRRWRRRYRNRYPGPIPTPEEWEPPPGPIRIGLQAGHWRAHEAPRELSGLKENGTRWEEMAEWEANLEIVRRTATMLQELGYEVDVLPAVVPPDYRAHLFIAVHADGSNDPRARGYRVAAPRRDATGRATTFASLLERSYRTATGLDRLPSTRRMRGYYAFNFRRYEHALHPMTVGVILETGFLTSARDRTVIVDDPDRAARGIVEAVRAFDVTALPVASARPAGESTPVSATSSVPEPTPPAASLLDGLGPSPQRLSVPPPSGPARPGARRRGS